MRGIEPTSLALEIMVLDAELRERRMISRGLVTAAWTGLVVAGIFLFHEQDAAVTPAVEFVVSLAAAALLVLAAWVVWRQQREVGHVRGFRRLFLDPHVHSSELTALRRNAAARPPRNPLSDDMLLGLVIVIGALVAGVVWIDQHPPGTWRVLAVLALLLIAVVGGALTLIGALPSKRPWLSKMADGIDAMQVSGVRTWPAGDPCLKRDGSDFLVAARASVPDPERLADAFFGLGQWERVNDPEWNRFTPRPNQEALHAQADQVPLPDPASLMRRSAPTAAVIVGGVGVVAVVLSALGARPTPLPGWALESPALYVTARALAVFLVAFIVANLLVSLASGRVLAKVGKEGLEFAGLGDDLLKTEARSARSMEETQGQVRDLQESAKEIPQLSRSMVALAEHVRNLEERLPEAPPKEQNNG
jgi:hypothetical protein